jgi:formylglycine-generating enzyme required for sulfatase activity
MIKVQGGTFTMGATAEQGSDAWDNEKPTHQVTLSDYYIGETEVTQELWQAVMGTTIQEQAKKGSYDISLYGVGNSYPMYSISWYDCQTFITKLNQLTGKNFRLPTEAEWEYAARGGQKSKGYKYAGSNTLSNVAWYMDNSSSKTHPVKQKQANELGLYDMTGNVREWCQDWYGSYSSNAQTNPTGSSSEPYRVYRGGNWNSSASNCRVAKRNYHAPGYRDLALGFRVVLLP